MGGEYAGQFANLRSLVYVVAPLLFTTAFKFVAEKGRPRLAYLLPAIFGYIIPGLMHISWSRKEMFPEEYEDKAKEAAK